MPLSGEIHWDIWVLWKDKILDILVLTRGQRAHAAGGHSAMRIPGSVWGASRCEIWRNRARAQILHAPSLLWASPPSPCLLGCLECPHLASFLFKSLLSMCWGAGPYPPLSSSSRSIKLAKSRKFNGSIGPEFIGPSFGVDSADWSHCQLLKFCTIILGNVLAGLLKVSNISRVRKR